MFSLCFFCVSLLAFIGLKYLLAFYYCLQSRCFFVSWLDFLLRKPSYWAAMCRKSCLLSFQYVNSQLQREEIDLFKMQILRCILLKNLQFVLYLTGFSVLPRSSWFAIVVLVTLYIIELGCRPCKYTYQV